MCGLPCLLLRRYPRPAVTVDTVIVAQPSGSSPAKLLLIKRKNDPFKVRLFVSLLPPVAGTVHAVLCMGIGRGGARGKGGKRGGGGRL